MLVLIEPRPKRVAIGPRSLRLRGSFAALMEVFREQVPEGLGHITIPVVAILVLSFFGVSSENARIVSTGLAIILAFLGAILSFRRMRRVLKQRKLRKRSTSMQTRKLHDQTA